MTRYPVTGKTVLITGAVGGIGAATARRLVDAGAQVALVDLDPDRVAVLAAELGPGALGVAADVTDPAAMAAAVAAAIDRFGRIDVCFANAGIAAASPTTIAGTGVEEFERIIEIDLLGVWRTVRACLPAVTEARGHFLLTASVYAFYNGAANAAYAASKAGVEALGRALRAELAGTGTTAGVLYPGWTDTAIIRPSHDDAITAELIRLGNPGPLGRVVAPEQIAEAALRGIERRRPRTIAPRVWVPLSLARGPFMALTDAVLDRHTRMQKLLRRVDRSR